MMSRNTLDARQLLSCFSICLWFTLVRYLHDQIILKNQLNSRLYCSPGRGASGVMLCHWSATCKACTLTINFLRKPLQSTMASAAVNKFHLMRTHPTMTFELGRHMQRQGSCDCPPLLSRPFKFQMAAVQMDARLQVPQET